IVNTGDASIDSAKKAGDISLVSSVDVVPDGQISVEAGYIPHAVFL
ncbi:TRL-like family protein, partial [Salmonella enterica]